MPNPPKPIEEKRRLGNPGKRPLPSGALALAPLVPAGRLWELDPADAFEAALRAGQRWLGESDVPVVAMLRQGLEERAELRERALGGSAEARRELRELEKQITAWLGSLGFDPAARARLGLAEVKAASTLEALRERRSAGQAVAVGPPVEGGEEFPAPLG